jgi:hypothetical protein
MIGTSQDEIYLHRLLMNNRYTRTLGMGTNNSLHMV